MIATYPFWMLQSHWGNQESKLHISFMICFYNNNVRRKKIHYWSNNKIRITELKWITIANVKWIISPLAQNSQSTHVDPLVDLGFPYLSYTLPVLYGLHPVVAEFQVIGPLCWCVDFLLLWKRFWSLWLFQYLIGQLKVGSGFKESLVLGLLTHEHMNTWTSEVEICRCWIFTLHTPVQHKILKFSFLVHLIVIKTCI